MRAITATFLSFYCLLWTVISQPLVEGKSCGSLKTPAIDGATVINSTAKEWHNLTSNGIDGSISACIFTTYLTHGNAGDEVRIEIWLPLGPHTSWNGYFQGTGGGGNVAGFCDLSLGPAVARGYAAGCTDAGVSTVLLDPVTWGQDRQAIINFGYLSIHEMTVVGKAITKDFYGRPASHSFFTGCSRGGQQAHQEAQRYPEDYDGILSAAAPIGWARGAVSVFWPYLIQNIGAGGFVTACKMDAFLNATIAHCDLLDGAMDGIISNPPDCGFEPESLIGKRATCNGITTEVFTEYDASIWRSIHEGPRDANGSFPWFGLPHGTPFKPQAAGPPDFPSQTFITEFLLGDPNYDYTTIDEEQFWDLWHQSIMEFDEVWGTDNPNLSPFKERGGKFLAWHGWADPNVAAYGSTRYWEAVKQALGGSESTVDEFYRLFMIPGAGHCAGPVPDLEDLNTLVDWVINGVPPETLPKVINGMHRKVCKHPKKLSYKGLGDVHDANNWDCIAANSFAY